MKNHSSSSVLLVSGVLLALLGLALGTAGAWLIVLGGSWYYLLAALAMLLAGVMLTRRSATALWSFAALLLGTLAWSLWEVGFDWWPLAARLGVLLLVGAFVLGLWVVRSLGGGEPAGVYGADHHKRASWRRGGGLTLSLSLVASALGMLFSLTRNVHEIASVLPVAQGQGVQTVGSTSGVPEGEWHAYGRTGYGQRYSPLTQITPANVSQLQVAWQFRTGDMRGQPGDPVETTYEVTPLKVGDRLYLCNPHQSAIALNSTTGAEMWRYDPEIEGSLALQHLTCRGLSYQPPGAAANGTGGETSPSGVPTAAALPVASARGIVSDNSCAHGKLFMPAADARLIALNPDNPVKEIDAPQGAAPGDHTAPSQPKTALSFDPPMLQGRDMWGATMFDQLACRIAFHRLRYEGRFMPPSTQGSLSYPGNFGVFNWSSVAVDPKRQIAFTTPAYLAFVSTLVPRPNDTALMVQTDGSPKGALPALNENFGAPFAAKLGPFLSPLGFPCTAPPWGYVAGADLTSGKIVWEHRNGTVRDLAPVPLPFRLGVPNLGGPIMTAGGVAFLSGTLDYYVRGDDVSSGEQLWESRLPAGGQATPMTYTGADGRQSLLVVAGGHGSTHTKAGDSVIAYALPAR